MGAPGTKERKTLALTLPAKEGVYLEFESARDQDDSKVPGRQKDRDSASKIETLICTSFGIKLLSEERP